MSCWVAASVAAEFWGIPVAQVMARIRAGEVPFRRELGFLLVDVAPYSPRLERTRIRPAIRPQTFRVVEAENASDGQADCEEQDPNPEPEPPAKHAPADWRKVRIAVASRRIAPRRPPVAA